MLEDHPIAADREQRLRRLGFSFHPFERTEASNDPYIHEYLIGHEMFAIAWEKSSAVLFAPAGGGKTAMRIYTLRACWLSESQRLKFPIAYDFPLFVNPGESYSLESHKIALASAAATDILLACAYRPEIYLELAPEQRVRLLTLIQSSLPSDLGWNLAILEETAAPRQLSLHLDRTYILPAPPTEPKARAFYRDLQADFVTVTPVEVAPALRFDRLLNFIRQDFGFESVFILLDGVDGITSLADDPAAQFRATEPLVQQALDWTRERLFLKAFLPINIEPILAEQAREFYQQSLHAAIAWDVPKLAEILRRRVYVASQGKFGSLDAISSPALRDVETLIAQRARPLPREAIVLAGNVLDNFIARSGAETGYLEPEDLELADRQYKKRMINP